MSDENQNSQSETPMPEISQAKRKRLQQLFDHATLQNKQKNYDYAAELLTQCVVGEPGNVAYVQLFFDNLRSKYQNNKKGNGMAFLKTMGPRGAIKKAVAKKDWLTVLDTGLKALFWNPWDTQILTALAKASQEVGFVDSPLLYLKMALEANPKDVSINRVCAFMLEDLGRDNDAFQCWRRISEVRQDDEEAQSNMSRLMVKKTIGGSGPSTKNVKPKTIVRTTTKQGTTEEMTLEERLERQIREQPKDPAKYSELADIYIQNEDYAKVIDVLTRALNSCGEIEGMRDKLEDAQIRKMRQDLLKLEEKQGRASEEWKKARQAMNDEEMRIWENRCQRYPNNLAFKYDLGVRYQIAKRYDDAIKQFQIAKREPRRTGLCALALGQCFQQIKQYRLAMASYQEAIEKTPDREADTKKKAYYLAGKLAMGLKQLDQADKFLTQLADMEYGYRDVSQLLEELAKMKGGNSEE